MGGEKSNRRSGESWPGRQPAQAGFNQTQIAQASRVHVYRKIKNMSTFDELFITLPTFRIAICCEHCSAVTARSVVSHVGSQHRDLSASNRQRIASEATALQADDSLAADISGIQFPRGVIRAIDGLAVWADGKKCVLCGYIHCIRKHIQQHCRSEHSWANPRGRGRKSGAGPAGGLGEA